MKYQGLFAQERVHMSTCVFVFHFPDGCMVALEIKKKSLAPKEVLYHWRNRVTYSGLQIAAAEPARGVIFGVALLSPKCILLSGKMPFCFLR